MVEVNCESFIGDVHDLIIFISVGFTVRLKCLIIYRFQCIAKVLHSTGFLYDKFK